MVEREKIGRIKVRGRNIRAWIYYGSGLHFTPQIPSFTADSYASHAHETRALILFNLQWAYNDSP